MMATVHFNDPQMTQAGEVNDVRTDQSLSSKMEADRP
jgi:hypothetical protein